MDALNRVAGPGRDLLARVDAALLAAGAPVDAPIWPLLRRTGALPGEALDFALALDAEALLSAAAELRGRAAEFAEQRAELGEQVGGSQPGGQVGAGTQPGWQGAAGSQSGGQVGPGSQPGWQGAAGSQLGGQGGGSQPGTQGGGGPRLSGVQVGDAPWQGAGAEAFAAQWRALATYIGDGAAPDQASLSGRLRGMSAYLEALGQWQTDLRGTLAGALAEALGSAEAVTLRSVPPLARGLGPDTAGNGAVARAAATVGAHVLAPVERALRTGHDLHDEWAPWLAELPYRPPTDLSASGFSAITRVEL